MTTGVAAADRLVGREREWDRLVAAFEAACAGHGATVLVGGDAGIGKTRLVAELAAYAVRRGAAVRTGRCIDLVGRGVPYLAVAEALRGGPDPFAAAGDGPDRVFAAVDAVLTDLAAAGPVVLVLEDLHWADASTLDLVARLARVVRDRRIVLVATHRTDESPVDPLARVVVQLCRARDAEAVEVGPLPAADLRDLLEARAGGPLPAELTAAVAHRSGGNPFFAEELLASVVRGDRSLPRLLREALAQRLSTVDERCRSVLRLTAAVGRDVPYRLLAVLHPEPEEVLRTALRAAVDQGILVPDHDASAYRFRHALLGEAAYATLLPGEREALHGRVAAILDGDRGAAPAEVARHWVAADRPVEALEASVRAARAAQAAAGLAEAVHHLEEALRAWPRVPDPGAVAGLDLPALLAWAAELADLTGNGRRAAGYARRAVALVDAAAEPVRAALLHERLGGYLMPLGERAAALAACRRAARLVPADPPSAERAAVLTTLGNALMLSWRHAESRAVCEEALAAAAAAGDDRPALRAAGILAIDLLHLGSVDTALERADRARLLASARGTPRDAAHAHALHCEVLIAAGRPAEAVRVAAAGLAAARRLGVEGSFGSLLAGYAAEGCLEVGDWPAAAEHLADALRAGARFWGHYPQLVRAELAAGRGDFALARECLEAAAPGAAQPTSAARHARVSAELALWEGRPADALAAARAALTAAPADGTRRAALAALGLRAAADLPGADPSGLLDDARREAGTGAVPQAAAWLAVAEAEVDRSVAAWSRATDRWEALGRPHRVAYCRWRLAEAYQATGRESWRATEAARAAHRAAVRLGAEPLRREVELFALRCRLDLAGPPSTVDERPPLGLTAREAEVLRLLARGYTNREIAGELTISPKTASVHVTHILRKLGVSRRTDAAALAHRLGR